MTSELPRLDAGIYRHYKGHHYQVLGYAHDSTIEGRVVVVYVGLELEDARPGPRMAVREVDEFFGQVKVCHGVGYTYVPRFTYVGHAWPPR